jgi:O-antigen/teichoic acid export membrane protein
MALNPIKRLAGETAVYGLGTIIPRLLNYFLVPFYTRVFEQDAYGQITELYAWVGIVMVFLTYGMETAFFRYAELEKDSKKVFNTATSALLITSLSFIALISLFLGDVSAAIEYQGHQEYIILLGIVVAIDAFTSLPFAYLRYQNKAKRFSLIKILSVLLNVTLNIFFIVLLPKMSISSLESVAALNGDNRIVFVFLANLFSSLLSLLLLLPEMRSFRLRIDRVLLKKMLSYGLPILIVGVGVMINEVADKILLKYFLVDKAAAHAQIGIYGANYKLAILMMLFIQMFRYAAEPFFFRESGKTDAKEIYSKVMTYFVIFTWMIFLGVMLYIDIFKYFIGPGFWEGLVIVPIVLMAKLFLGIFYNLSVWYKLTNKTLYGAAIALTGAFITIALNVYLIPKIGYMGSAWANFFCYLSMMLISFFWGRKIYKVDYNLLKILLYSGLAVGLYFISISLKISADSTHILINTLLMGIYFLVIYFWEVRKPGKVTLK